VTCELVLEARLSPMMLFNETFKAYNSFILLAVPFLPAHRNTDERAGHRPAGALSRSMVAISPARSRRINVLLSVSSPERLLDGDAASQSKIFHIDAQ